MLVENVMPTPLFNECFMSVATANHHRGTNPFEELLLEADRHQVNDIFSSEFDQADCMNIPMTMQPF